MLVRWTQPAADDLLHICDYTAERFGAAQARRVADAIYETAASLQDMPNRGRKGRKPDTREMLISGFPFVIIYRVGQVAVEIARAQHLLSAFVGYRSISAAWSKRSRKIHSHQGVRQLSRTMTGSLLVQLGPTLYAAQEIWQGQRPKNMTHHIFSWKPNFKYS